MGVTPHWPPGSRAAGPLVRVQLADYGSAFEFRDAPHVATMQTLFYRAPEVVLGAPHLFGVASDLWSVGCVLAEILCGRPLFSVANEAQLLVAVEAVLGPAPRDLLGEATRLAAFREVLLGLERGASPVKARELDALAKWRRVLQRASAGRAMQYDEAAVQFLSQVLCWDPADRLSVEEALAHAFVTDD